MTEQTEFPGPWGIHEEHAGWRKIHGPYETYEAAEQAFEEGQRNGTLPRWTQQDVEAGGDAVGLYISAWSDDEES
jgi:hypothetical protein